MKKGYIITIAVCVVLLAVISIINTSNQANNTVAASEEIVSAVSDSTSVKDYAKAVDSDKKADTFNFETDLYRIVFDTKGGSIKSLSMKEHANADGDFVDLIFKGEKDHNAFLLYWGDDLSKPVDDVFSYSVSKNKVVFTNDYVTTAGKPFTVVKTFEFKDGEYLFAVNVELKSAGALNFGDYDYSLGYEPQVGPSFVKIKNNNYDYRRIYANVYNKGKLKKSTIGYKNGDFYTVKHMKWFSLTGKYFTVTVLPEDSANIAYKYTAKQSSTDTVSQTNSFFVSVPATDGSDSKTFYYYCGPQLKAYLGSYYSGTDNAWGLKNTDLDEVMEGGSAFGWLESILKWCLRILHKIIPNYGICIIVLTIILKAAMWPLTKKSTESTSKMSKIQPLTQEIQKKYPDNPQKQNAEMQALYKQYGINPLGGCLPLLIQFPILIAFYGLLNKHFELRGAMFIPGWIPDLSLPDHVATLPFNIPLLGNEIHLMPLIYTVSMIFSMQFSQSKTQQQDAKQQSSMKLMTWGMPIMFFFVLYSAPSGLFLYWTVQNILSIVQQIWSNKKVDSIELKPISAKAEVKEPEAIRKYKEKLAKLEQAKAQAEKEAKKNNKKGK